MSDPWEDKNNPQERLKKMARKLHRVRINTYQESGINTCQENGINTDWRNFLQIVKTYLSE